MARATHFFDESDSDRHKKKYHLSMEFLDKTLDLGLFQVFQVCDLSCSSDYQYPPHQQICFEISYIVSGHGIYERNNVPYEVTPNTVFLVNDHDLHAVRSSKDDPLRYMCLGFSFCKEHPDFEKYLPLYNFFEHLENPIAEDHFKLFDCFTLALNEISAPTLFSMEMLESCILQIIVHTYRDLSNYRARNYTDTLELHASNPLAYEICNYIDTNLTDIKKLSDISQALGYSYAYLSKIFSQSMNLSIKDYYTQRRFETAAKMLAQDFTIARISQVLHFSDDSSFCKAFKKYYHTTPAKYRELLSGSSDQLSI